MAEPAVKLPALLDCPPLSALPAAVGQSVLAQLQTQSRDAGDIIYRPGEGLPGLFFVLSGSVEVSDPHGAVVSVIEIGETFGTEGLIRDGVALTRVVMKQAGQTALLPAEDFKRLIAEQSDFADFFQLRRARRKSGQRADVTTRRVGEFMTPKPVTIGENVTVLEASRLIERHRISCLLVLNEGRLTGILTTSDLVGRVLAQNLPPDTPVKQVMTPSPRTVDINALGHDTFLMLSKARIGHMPVMQGDRLVGVVTRSDLLSQQAASASFMVLEIGKCRETQSVAKVVHRLPDLLVQLNGAGVQSAKLTRLITDIGDAATRRFLELAQDELGPAPVPYLWLACGQSGPSGANRCL